MLRRFKSVFRRGMTNHNKHAEIMSTEPPPSATPWGGNAPEGLVSVHSARKHVAVLAWDDIKRTWGTAELASNPAVITSTPSTITLCTYNIWFDKKLQRERFDAMLDLVLPSGDQTEWPDVVALQEVTKQTTMWILADSRVRTNYGVTDSAVTISETFYGVVTLVHKRLAPFDAAWYPFGHPLITEHGRPLPGRSIMGRGLLAVSMAHGLVVGNVHLESPVSNVRPETRRAQLELSTALLHDRAMCTNGEDRWFLMGDFNFTSVDEDSGIPDTGGVDVWSTVHPNSVGMTFDHRNNANIKAPYVKRPDRIVARRLPQSPPTMIEMIGVDVCTGIDVQPSDHFGLLATVAM